jgi:exosortase A-associated hydrolase 2
VNGTFCPSFIDGRRGRIFVLLRRPQTQPVRDTVLIVAPFAEEMNKSRRLLADTTQALVAAGIATVTVDFYGTGDSGGEFRDADWECWQDDLARTARWAAEQGSPVTALLCVRLGCILGARAARDIGGIRRTVFWQPVTHGERFLTQFLRLRVAASMMESKEGESVGQLRARLAQGETIEVAGYELSPALVAQIDRLQLVPELGPHLGELQWMEVVRDAEGTLPAATAALLQQALAAGISPAVSRIVSEPFWSSVEIVRSAELTRASAAALAGIRA